MLRILLAASIAAGSAISARAFALLGPFETWMTADLYYNPAPANIFGTDLGGPQNLGEEYRWNVPTIYYAFDYTFLDYFGQRGVEEVEKAIAYFNALPNYSELSNDLREYPNSTMRVNHRASALNLIDVKSMAMMAILEELGVAHAERSIWTIRQRELLPGAQCPVYRHRVIKRNFDPETWFPTSYVNDILYTYYIEISCPPAQDYSHALEFPVDPTQITHTSVSSGGYTLPLGGFHTGLTRDDVGALRYLYRASNYNSEDIPTGSSVGLGGVVSGGGGGGGGSTDGVWTPIAPPSTNVVTDPTTDPTGGGATTAIGLRPGVNRVRFVRVNYDSTLGANFDAFTNVYNSPVVVNGRLVSQTVRRPVLRPDMTFSAADLLDGAYARTVPLYQQAPVPTGGADLNGPGVLPPGVSVTFGKIGPRFESVFPLLGEDTATYIVSLGSFDGSTNAPVLYPSHLSIQDLERQVLGR